MKAHFDARDESLRVKAEMEKATVSSAKRLFRHFKKPSPKAIKLGLSQLRYEAMVRKAEKKLVAIKHKSIAGMQSAKARAEELAEELFHKPGTLLTKDEIAHLWLESGCQELREPVRCNFPTANIFRTVDGTCNNLRNPLFGAAGTPFRRLIPGQYEDGISSQRGALQARSAVIFRAGPLTPPVPSARHVSATVVEDVLQDEIPFTHILMQWGQFLDHDLDFGPELEEECVSCIFTEICEPIFVADRDSKFGIGTAQNGDCLRFARSSPTCDASPPGSFSPREQVNDITSFIDGSMVYGSSDRVSRALREFRGGRLRVGFTLPGNRQPSLPIDVDGLVACPNQINCFLAGDVRANEQISLTTMQTLWMREHNRVANALARINPHWDDERVYQEARKIVGAEIQKITYIDYLPKVLGPAVFDRVIGPYTGYNPEVDASIPNSFSTAAYRYGHSLVRPFFDRLNAGYTPQSVGPLALVNAFFNPGQYNMSQGTDSLLRGLVTTNCRRVDEFMNPTLTSRLFEQPKSPGMDLASLNIQRGRDHGLPPYATWRSFCQRIFGLDLVSDFENDLTLVRFLQVYGSLDTIDLWVGGLAEDRLPNSLLGATFSCLFGLTFVGTREGDRFFYENPGVFTRDQLQEVRQATLSRVICDNSDGINEIQPDAYLSNQTRVSCNRLPSMDLSKFREQVCYTRLRVRRPNFATAIRVFSRATQVNFLLSTATLRATAGLEQFQCIAITCPTSTVPDDIIVYSSNELIDRFDITPNAAEGIPPNRYPRRGVYRSFWPLTQFESRRGGVFFSLQECEGSSQFSMTLENFPNFSTSVSEASILAQASRGSASSQDTDSSVADYTDEVVPDIVEDILNSVNPNADVQSVSSKTSTGATIEEHSDKSLLQDLEDALTALA